MIETIKWIQRLRSTCDTIALYEDQNKAYKIIIMQTSNRRKQDVQDELDGELNPLDAAGRWSASKMQTKKATAAEQSALGENTYCNTNKENNNRKWSRSQRHGRAKSQEKAQTTTTALGLQMDSGRATF